MIAALVRVGDISDQIRGVSYGKSDAISQHEEGYLPVLRAGNITNTGLTFDDLVFVPAARISPKQQIRKGDVVIAASSGSLDIVGKAAMAQSGYEGGFGAFCKVLRPNPAKVEAAYFAHYFQTREYRQKVSSLAAGANINNLKNEHLDDLLLPLPSLPEQRRIASILDQADALRAKRRKALVQLDGLTQSIFIEMFGDPANNPKDWPLCSMGDLTEKITDGEHINPEFSASGMPIVMAGNVLENSIDINGAKKVEPILGHKFRSKCNPERGDLLVVSRGATIGRMCSVNVDDTFCLMGSVILIKVKKDKLNTAFVNALLKHPVMRSALYKTSGSSAQQAIYLKDLKNLSCIQPPLNLQHQFSELVLRIDELRVPHSQSLLALDSMFASLQHRAFRGEL